MGSLVGRSLMTAVDSYWDQPTPYKGTINKDINLSADLVSDRSATARPNTSTKLNDTSLYCEALFCNPSNVAYPTKGELKRNDANLYVQGGPDQSLNLDYAYNEVTHTNGVNVRIAKVFSLDADYNESAKVNDGNMRIDNLSFNTAVAKPKDAALSLAAFDKYWKERSQSETNACTYHSWLMQQQKEEPGVVTTLMLSNLPWHFDLAEISRILHMLGFANTFDMVYLPTCKGKRQAFAFVNFKNQKYAEQLMATFRDGSSALDETWQKLVTVKAAVIQGYDANMKSYKSKPLLRGTLMTFPDHGDRIDCNTSW
jgi:hypothetical protein